MTARLGSYIARELDWVLQHNQAARELAQLDKQIVAAQIRLEIAEHELRNHRKQLEDSREVEDHLRDKYTSKELYSWMVGQMSGVYFQAYDLAYAAAKRAEQCFRHELGIRDSRWIQFGYWDSLKKGLLAGEKLHHDLKRMEIAYLDLSPRELELTKHLSLAQLAPLELVRLRETGQCSLRVPEEIYDLDYPGHYFRRTKSVSLTLPCVAGPYTTISCTLRLTRSSVRINAANGGSGYARNTDNQSQPVDDLRFVDDDSVPVQAIATSSAQNDSGVFELNFRDERYLPFEGTGTISEWRLELFTDATNADFGRALRQFDFGSISDAVLHLKYTAREGAGEFKTSAISHLREYFRDGLAAVLLLPVDLRREFGSQWNRFAKSCRFSQRQRLRVGDVTRLVSGEGRRKGPEHQCALSSGALYGCRGLRCHDLDASGGRPQPAAHQKRNLRRLALREDCRFLRPRARRPARTLGHPDGTAGRWQFDSGSCESECGGAGRRSRVRLSLELMWGRRHSRKRGADATALWPPQPNQRATAWPRALQATFAYQARAN